MHRFRDTFWLANSSRKLKHLLADRVGAHAVHKDVEVGLKAREKTKKRPSWVLGVVSVLSLFLTVLLLSGVPAAAQGATPTTTTISPSANPIYGGQTVTLTINVSGSSGTPTGSVTLYNSCAQTCGNGFQSVGTATLSNGQASFTRTLTTYAGGQASYMFKAIYGGDTTFAASESSALNEGVNQGSTSTAVTSSANPSQLGQSLTLTATLTALTGVSTFSHTYAGDMIFYDDSTVIGQKNIDSSGVATMTTSALSPGPHSITAKFAGDLEHTGSTSSVFTQTISQNGTPTTTTITPSANPTYGGQTVTLTLNVSTASGTPTGSVTLYQSCAFTCGNGFQSIGTATLSNGQATFTPALTTYAGAQSSYMFKAIYGGDATFAPSQSSTLNEGVNQGTTSTAVTSSANPSPLSQSVTLTATITAVTGVSTFSHTYAGDMIFYDGAAVIGQKNIDSSGVATLTTSALSLGPHSITAKFAGDLEHTGSTSPVFTQTVAQTGTPTTTTISPSANPIYGGQAVTLTINVSGSGGPPTGSVTIYNSCAQTCGNGFQSIGTVTLSNGQATIMPTLTTYAGGQASYMFKATYGGDATFASSDSSTLNEGVNQGSTSTAVTSSANLSPLGQAVTFTATLTALTGVSTFSHTYAGDMIFYDGVTVIGQQNINSNGVATMTTSALSPGPHSITATFAGDVEHTGSTSPVFTQTVNGTYTITVSASPPAGGTVGGGGTFAGGSSRTVTATPNSGYSFVNWTEGGNQVSASASYNFTLAGNRILVANFASAAQVYDGIIVPTSNTECPSSTPIFWPATYRPYVSNAASGAGQPSQLVVFHNHGRNGIGLRLASAASNNQFNGNVDKQAGFYVVNTDVQDKTQSNTGNQPPGASGRTIHMVQVPNNVTALDVPVNRWIKITGTVVMTSDGTSPGLFCAKSIVGVFVRRPQ